MRYFLVSNTIEENDYRIYSRISRNILLDFWRYFFQFEQYGGHKVEFLLFNIFLHDIISPTLKKLKNYFEFWTIFTPFFKATYTLVDLYASIYGILNLFFYYTIYRVP